MSAILDFYRDGHRQLWHPRGYTYFDIVNNWNDEQWESCHDFIQWVFPLKEASNFNADAPLLTDEDIAIFKTDIVLQQAVFWSFRRFLKFLGLTCSFDIDGQKLVTSKIEFPKNTDDLQQQGNLTHDEIINKLKVWSKPNHNWLRITRCLMSLRLLGHEEASASFYDALCKIYDENSGVTQDTFEYWTATQH